MYCIQDQNKKVSDLLALNSLEFKFTFKKFTKFKSTFYGMSDLVLDAINKVLNLMKIFVVNQNFKPAEYFLKALLVIGYPSKYIIKNKLLDSSQ